MHPPLDCHFILVTHYSDIPDQYIESWGPIEPQDLDRTITAFDELEWYHRPRTRRRRGALIEVESPTEHGLLHERVDIHLRGMYDDARRQLFHPADRTTGLYLQEVSKDCAAGRYQGDLFALNPQEIVESAFREAEGNAKRYRQYLKERKVARPSVPYEEPTPSGYTAVLFPPRHIGKNPATTIHERFWGKHAWSAPGNKVLDRTYAGMRAFAMYEGIIGLVHPDKILARNFLNMVCVALRKEGLATAHLRPRDMGPFVLRAGKDMEFQSHSYNPEDRPTAPVAQRWFNDSAIPITTLDRAFRRAAKLLDHPDLDAYSDLLEAESQLEEERFRQAFFLAWTVVERRLGEVWELLLTRATKNKPNDVTVEWRPTVVAAALTRTGLLPRELGSQVRDLNTKRNDILHGNRAARKDAEWMLAAARSVVAELRASEKRLRRQASRTEHGRPPKC